MGTPTAWSDDHFIAGDVALDLANTVFRRTPEVGADLLGGAGDLGAWLRHAGLLPADALASDEDLAAALPHARAIRRHLWAVFEARTEGRELPVEDLAGLLDAARRGTSGDIVVGPDGSVTPLTVPGALAGIALHAIGLALTPPAHPVRACDRCGWFFLDTSRSRRRRWCSMSTCGNQAKAARYRATHG